MLANGFASLFPTTFSVESSLSILALLDPLLFTLQLMVALQPCSREFSRRDRGLHGTSGFALMLAVAEFTVIGQRLNITKRFLQPGVG